MNILCGLFSKLIYAYAWGGHSTLGHLEGAGWVRLFRRILEGFDLKKTALIFGARSHLKNSSIYWRL